MMGRLAALLLIAAVMLGLQRVTPPMAASTVTLPLGFALIAAYGLGAAAERLRVPRLSGYLLFGLLCGPYLLNVITSTMARDLQVVNGLALALIALVAGLELNVRALRPYFGAVLTIGGGVMLVSMLVLTVVLYAAWTLLPLGDVPPGLPRVAASLLSAALIVSFSPTVTIAVIAESRARGVYVDLVMAVVVLADLLLIMIFALGMQFARLTTATAVSDVSLTARLAWELLGSLAFGGIAGAGFAAYLRIIGRETTLALIGLCAVLAIVAPRMHFELILCALAAGLVVENIAPPEGEGLKSAVERGGLPVLVAFFAAAGASLQLDVLRVLGWTALAIATIRALLIYGVGRVVTKGIAARFAPARLIWLGLISQAGVTLGLASLLAAEFPTWGAQVRTLIVGLTGLHVIVGPILFKAGLQRTGSIPSSAPAPLGAPADPAASA